MKTSYLIAGSLATVAALWLASPYVEELIRGKGGAATAPAAAPPTADVEAKTIRVRVRQSTAQPFTASLVLNGQTEPSRQATLKGRTAGQIVAVEASEGSIVNEGDVIARMHIEDREARLAEAKALVAQRRIEYGAASKLEAQGYQSQTKLAESKALLEVALTTLRRAELDIEYTVIRAPFDGVLQTRLVEVGDYVGVGDPVATVIDLDPLLAVAQVSEREFDGLTQGAEGQARIITGDVVDGRITYVSSVGESGTRTFRIELEIPNADLRLPAGLTSELIVPRETVMAHKLSPAALTLDDAGRVGLKVVDDDNIVRFHVVRLVADGPGGIWLAGLPDEVSIITVGQEFVQAGHPVIPVPDGAVAPAQPLASGGAS